MCKVHNQIGSLTAIKCHLKIHDLNEFSSVHELINFQKNYPVAKQQITLDHTRLLNQEKSNLHIEIGQLAASIEARRSEVQQQLLQELDVLKQELQNFPSNPSNIFMRVIAYLKKFRIKRKIRDKEINFDSRIAYSLQQPVDEHKKLNNRYQFLESNFEEAVMQSSFFQLKELERKKMAIDEINTIIYGAIGEQKVSKELENLPDDYILINDFSCTFYPAIYNRQEKDYIKSVQIDHILIAPSGIFLIETKNWSEYSINNLSLRSPIKQIRRTSFALYKTLTSRITHLLDRHHWGEKKIPIKNLIVLINQKPIEEFRHVKVLTLKELRHYVEYFHPIFTAKETQIIADYLLRNNNRSISTK